MRSDIEAGRAFVRLYTKDQSKQGLQAWKAQLTAITASAATLTAGLATAAAAGGFLVKLAADAETTATSFKVLTGNVQDAEKLLAGLRKFGAETPFEFPELADASKKLLAFGVAIDDQIPTLTRIGDIASGLGIPIGELAELYGKAKVQGRLFAEDVNQLTGRGIPVIQEFAKQFGVADSEVRGLVESGKIGFPQLEKAFISLTSEGGKFNGMMAEQSKTLNGLLSTLKDNLTQAGTALGAMIMEGADLKDVVGQLEGVTANFQKAVEQAGPEVRESLSGIKDSFAAIVTEITGATGEVDTFKESLVGAARIAEDIAKALELIHQANQYTGTAFLFGQYGDFREQQEELEPKQRTPSKPVLPEPPAAVPLGIDPASLEAALAEIQGKNKPATPTAAPTKEEQKILDQMKKNRSAAVLGVQLPDDGKEAFDNTEYGRERRERNQRSREIAEEAETERFDRVAKEIGDTLGFKDVNATEPRRPPISGTFSAMAAAGMGSSQGPVERTAKATEEMKAKMDELLKVDKERLELERKEATEFVA